MMELMLALLGMWQGIQKAGPPDRTHDDTFW